MSEIIWKKTIIKNGYRCNHCNTNLVYQGKAVNIRRKRPDEIISEKETRNVVYCASCSHAAGLVSRN